MADALDKRISPRRWWRIALVAAALAVLLGGVLGTLFAGYLIGAREIFPHSFFARVDNRLERTFRGARAPARLEPAVYPTALIRLRSEVARVDTGRSPSAGMLSETGGGMTLFGPDILLLPYNGRIYAIGGAEDIRDTGLRAPDNNRAAYQAAADDPAFADYRFSPGLLRYNDIEYFRTEAGHGLIASYTEFHPDRACTTNTLARLDLPAAAQSIAAVSAAAEDWRVIFRTEPCLALKDYHLALEGHMAGGKVAFAAPDTLYLASSDFHVDGMRSRGAPIAQDPRAQYGKVLAMRLDGSQARILSMGHRNMQGLALTRAGDLLAVEHGPRGGDEINLIAEGANFGWPLESYGITYVSTAIPNALSFARHDRFEQPIFAWVPSIAPSAMIELEGFHPAWDGDLLLGSLIDQSLHRVRMQGSRPVYAERIPIGTRIRELAQLPDGRIVLWTDSQELAFLSAEEVHDSRRRLERFISDQDFAPRLANDLRTVITQCAECHSLQVDDHERAPSLAQIYGKPIAATAYGGYSPALRAVGGTWTRENLAAFLDHPQGFAPGTTMPDPGIGDATLRDAVIAYLADIERDF